MRLFTPVSPEDADRLTRGAPVAGELFWVDRLVPEEADDEAVWMTIELPETDIGQWERPVARELAYREFVLPASILAGRQATRAVSA